MQVSSGILLILTFVWRGYVLPAARADKTDGPDWGYTGANSPSTWAEKFPQFCAGTFQSPVELSCQNAVHNYKKPLDFSPAYTSDQHVHLAGEISNTGKSIKFVPNDDVNGFKVTGEVIGDQVYQVLQLHFHWGSTSLQGSEHTINGQSFPLELHVVHINTKYLNRTEEALKASDGLLVLGFLFYIPSSDSYSRNFKPLKVFDEAITDIVGHSSGDGDGLFGGITAAAAAASEKKDQFKVKVPIKVNLGQFLSAVNKKNFYQYQGSLTTPGCNEVVTWIVFDKAIAAGDHQIASFRRLKATDGRPLVDNFRPPQPLNGRKVYHHLATAADAAKAVEMAAKAGKAASAKKAESAGKVTRKYGASHGSHY